MNRNGWPHLPHRQDVQWHREDWGDADFWEYVDSQPYAGSDRCQCDPNDPAPDCRRWHCQRDGQWCFAANSRGERCSKRVSDGTPFCEFHIERAWMAMFAAASVVTRKRYARYAKFEEKCARRELDEVLASVGVEQHQQWDAHLAAERIEERVYFYHCGDVVKIGRSRNVAQRLKTLGTTKAPEGVDVRAGHLLGTIPGGHRTEGWLHRKYRPHRLVGEWFEYAPIADSISAVLAQHAVPEAGAA